VTESDLLASATAGSLAASAAINCLAHTSAAAGDGAFTTNDRPGIVTWNVMPPACPRRPRAPTATRSEIDAFDPARRSISVRLTWEHMFVTHPAYLRDKARSLRTEKGLTIDELAERLALSRTTIYYWVRDLPIPYVTASRSAAQLRAAEANKTRARRRREEAYADGAAEFDGLAEDPTFRDFVALYIAEGYKRNRNCVSIANSDAAVIAVAVAWLPRLTDRPMGFSIQHHADQDLDELRAYWGRTLGIDGNEIRFQRKSNSGQLGGRTWRCQYGVLSVRVHDTLLRARLQAWIDFTREAWTKLAPNGV
jgi:excisionase family DNA binding protein